ATATIDTEDLTSRVEIRSADNDVAQLAHNFNQMLDRLEQGVANQRQFLDDAAHELRTPLTIIRGNLELMEVGDAEDVDQTRTLVLDELDRMKRLVSDLLMLARSQRPGFLEQVADEDRKSTRLNSSHVKISYAVFCLKKKKKTNQIGKKRSENTHTTHRMRAC